MATPLPYDLPPFTTIEHEAIFSTPVFRLERLRRRSGRSGREHDFFRVEAPDWVNVVAITRDRELLLVRQERHGALVTTLEIPGGVVDPGEDPASAALRELEEETGHRGRRAVPLGWVHPNPAILSNRCHTFLVTDAEPTGRLSPDEDEEIVVEKVPLADARRMVRDGGITHALVVAALYLLDASGG